MASSPQNLTVILDRAARDGADVAAALQVRHRDIVPPQTDEVLIRTVYVSADPAMITWARLAAPYNRTMPGDAFPGQVVGVIEESRVEGLEQGDVVSAFAPIQQYTTVRARGADTDAGSGGTLTVNRIPDQPPLPLELALSYFSHIGTAAISGIKHAAKIRAGQNVLVSGAAGATGSISAQIAKAYGARVIGVAGGPEKCARLVDEFGLDGAIDHRGDLDAQLSVAFPDGYDVFFDTVGGQVLDTALKHLAVGARVTICGASAEYGKSPADAYRFENIGRLIASNAGMNAYWVSDFFGEHFEEYMAELAQLYTSGAVKVPAAHVLDGIEAFPGAFELLMTGGNTGKLIVQVSPEPTR